KSAVHHTIAAVAGFVVAALVVFLVFDSADQQGAAQDGDAPIVVGAGPSENCGSIAVADSTDAASIETALAEMPEIVGANGAAVEITDKQQLRWFASLHAALSLCADQVSLTPNDNPSQLVVSAMAPADWNKQRASRHAVRMLAAAFDSGPFAVKRVTLTVQHGDATRSINVTRPVWNSYNKNAKRLKLGASIAGFQKLDKRVGFKPNELKISGW
ncbi:MAG: hypothetical protein ACC645_25455, partial [Pirellulales bacterium]